MDVKLLLGSSLDCLVVTGTMTIPAVVFVVECCAICARTLAIPAAAFLPEDCFGTWLITPTMAAAADELAIGALVDVGFLVVVVLNEPVGTGSPLIGLMPMVADALVDVGLLLVTFRVVRLGTGRPLMGLLMLLNGMDKRLIEGASGRPSVEFVPAAEGEAETNLVE